MTLPADTPWPVRCLTIWLPGLSGPSVEKLACAVSNVEAVPARSLSAISKALDNGLDQRVGRSVHDFSVYERGALLALVETFRVRGDSVPDSRFGICAQGGKAEIWADSHPTEWERLSAYGSCGTVFPRTRSNRCHCDICRVPQNRPRNPRLSDLPEHILDRRVTRAGGRNCVAWIGLCTCCSAEFTLETSPKGSVPSLCAKCGTPVNRQRRRRGGDPVEGSFRFDSAGLRRRAPAGVHEVELVAVGGVFETTDAELASSLRREGFCEARTSEDRA